MDPQDIETDDWKEVLPLETPACVLINQSKAQVFTCVSDKRCITRLSTDQTTNLLPFCRQNSPPF